MKTRVETTKFEAAHGHKPRGYGHWYFEAGDETIVEVGNYGKAKAAAVARVRGRVIYVLP